ncbi:ABC transporter ATP-binding protein [Oleiharenicola sp. Vm1]|uniref:ABC transporter ATP-binding protein n=1 Tax=Oleiharenicola sp. Vm1 TaxID=3398393 RepID=UPI0039F61647
MLQLDHLTQRYGALTALNDVSLTIGRGEFFGLLGPNGAGKSTLMSLVAGLREPAAGTLRLDGVALAGRPAEVVRAIGFVPQSVALYEDLTADENLGLYGRLYGLAGRKLAARIDACLDAVQLTDRRRHAVKTYSGGMQRRLNLAASLLHEPKLLLCDEPTVGVDPQSRNAIFDLLERLNRDGLTVIYSTHYMEEATRLCSRIGIIDHGRILALGTLDELLAQLPAAEVVSFARNGAPAPALAALARFGTLRERDERCEVLLAPGVRLADFFAATQAAGWPDRAFTLKRPTLEDLFLHLTGKTLRE